jgi:hypothetical protein
MRNESTYQVPIILTITYRQPKCSIDREDAQEELTDTIEGHKETIATMIGDLIDLDVEIDQVETARFEGSRVMV